MKKILSLFLAIIMMLSIVTVGALAAQEIDRNIYVGSSVVHTRNGDYAYFPITCSTPSYRTFLDNDYDADSIITMAFRYNAELLKPVDVIMGSKGFYELSTAEITKIDEYTYNGVTYNYILVEINIDKAIALYGVVFFNIKFEVLSEDIFDENGYFDQRGYFSAFSIVDEGDPENSPFCEWRIEKTDGTVKDISSYVVDEFRGADVKSYESLVTTDFETFIPTIESETDETTEVSLTADEVKILTFTPKQSGNYKIIVEGGARSAVDVQIYNKAHSDKLLGEGFVATSDETGWWILSFNQIMKFLDTEVREFMYVNARANKPIEIKLSDATSKITEELKVFDKMEPGLAECFLPSTVSVRIEPVDIEPIKPGHRPHVSHKDVYEFIPGCSGKYRFTSELENGAVPNITICDYTGCVITSKGFSTMSVDSDLNFDVTAELQEGETYLVHFENDARNNENEAVGTFSVEVEDLTIVDYIQNVTYIQQEDTHKDFTVTVNNRKQMIQFIEPDGGTRTYDRYNKNVSITSYNAKGEKVSDMSRELAYEVWQIHSNMSVGVEINVRGKENGKWDRAKYAFTIEPYNPVVSMELSSTSGKKGAVSAKVIADNKTEKVMFKMPDGSSVTVAYSAVDVDGNRLFKGNAWMNEDGLNEIKVYIRRDNVWKLAGTLEYTVE